MTEARADHQSVSSLQRRIVSALFLVPIGFAVIWIGGWVFSLFVALVAVLMAFEWNRLVSGKTFSLTFALHALVSLAAIYAIQNNQASLALAVTAGGAVLATVLSLRGAHSPLWAFGGVLYTTLPCISVVWLRLTHAQGLGLVLALVFVVIAIDTGAYWAGRTFGGPKLAPRFSPSKTWAGLAGGALWAGLAALISAFFLGWEPLWAFFALGLSLAVVSQAGDLAESAVKRHFNVKDMGSLIPGHGGVLDRFDGLMVATLVVVALVLTQA